MSENKIGLIGLAVMGANLAKNFASKGVSISVYNRTFNKTELEVESWNKNKDVLIENAKKTTPWLQQNIDQSEFKLEGFENLKDFVDSLAIPRKVIIMVKAGKPVDDVIEDLSKYLESGDTIIDCGNSNWHDTIRRQTGLENKGLNFVGCGVSGGEQGALIGPSIMPGGKKEIVDELLPLLKIVSAPDFNNKPCVSNVGLSASGHFVKMVHNGIEYALMQGIAEIYDILKVSNYSNSQIQEVFKNLNTGQNESFLLEITEHIFGVKDNLGDGYLIDKIKDQAGAKGTGKWTVEAALNLGIAVPSISAAVFARILSARTQAFKTKKEILKVENNNLSKQDLIEKLFEAYKIFVTSCYLQGLDLISGANEEFSWSIDLQKVIEIWQGGCIIRSRILQELPKLWNQEINIDTGELEFVCKYSNTPKLALNSALDYILSLKSDKFSTNLIQAQRDYFGSHTYSRTDLEGTFTGGWIS